MPKATNITPRKQTLRTGKKSQFETSIVPRDEKEARYDPLKGLTPELLRAYLDDWRRGWLPPLAVVIDEIVERCSIVTSVSGKAKRGVCRHGWEIITAEGLDKPEQKQAAAQAETLRAFFDQIEVTHALDRDQQGGVRLLLQHMMSAFGARYSVHELLWRPDAPLGLSAELRFVPLWFFENSTGRLRFLKDGTLTSQEDAIDLKPDQWFVNVMDGVMIAGASDFLKMNLAEQDELILSAKYGFPIPYIKVADSPGSDGWYAAQRTIAAIQGGDSAVMGTDGEIASLELKTGSYNPHPGIIERLSRSIAILWLGNDLSTISQGGSDSTGASLQGGSEDDQSEDNAIACEETIDRKLTQPVLRYAFGENVRPLAHLHIKGRNREDLADVLERFCKLSERKYPITIGHVSSALAIPLPADADPDQILQPPTQTLDQGQKSLDAPADQPDQPTPPKESDPTDPTQTLPDSPDAPNTLPPSHLPTSPQAKIPTFPLSNSALTETALAQALNLRPDIIPPEIPELFDRLLTRLQDDTISDAALIAEFEHARDTMPDYFGLMDHDTFADLLYRVTSAAAAQRIETTTLQQPLGERMNDDR